MSAAKHTPGPWRLRAAAGSRSLWRIVNAAGRVIGTISRPFQGVDAADADARLIAAAPELLEALQAAYDALAISYPLHSCDMDKRGAILGQARAAIAKAEGAA